MLKAHCLTFSYSHENTIFTDISFVQQNERCGLVGSNGSGKSTLLSILAGELSPDSGTLHIPSNVIYVPQYNLREEQFGSSKSEGMIQRRRLTQAFANRDSLILLDEPSNHLDKEGREELKNAIRRHRSGLIIASHDRDLLEILEVIKELDSGKLKNYGGGYSFYCGQKQAEREAKQRAVLESTRELRKIKANAQKSIAKQERKMRTAQQARGDSGLPQILLGARKRNAENTLSKLDKNLQKKVENARLSHL